MLTVGNKTEEAKSSLAEESQIIYGVLCKTHHEIFEYAGPIASRMTTDCRQS